MTLCFVLNVQGQRVHPFGQITLEEERLVQYAKDTTASAVVLYERGNNYFEVGTRSIRLIKEYHVKIKILKKQGFKEAEITIPFYRSKDASERIEKLKAVTHNGSVQSGVPQDQIFTSTVGTNYSLSRFAFPNVKIGSILEYSYTISSPYFYNFNGWSFQSHLPKLYSEFNAKIPGNYQYNRSLSGYLKLDIDDATLAKDCFYVQGYGTADCEVLKYAMKDVPAFKEAEDFMLAKENYISRIDFELSKWFRLDGTTKTYTKTWEYVDAEFRKDQDIGRQLTKKNFFEKSVPSSLLTEGDALTKAKNIYDFIKNHYTWNGNYGIYRDTNVKEAFAKKSGSIGEINISLINLLNAADIPTNLMVLSTRDNGLPKKSHPVMSDFNYIIAKTTIDGQEYLLDATDKLLPFGMLPYKCLNYYGRVMDFKKESYWQTISAETKNKKVVRAMVSFNPEEEKLEGLFDVIHMGYDAVMKKRELANNSEDAYIEKVEKSATGEFYITSYELLEKRTNERNVAERFKFEIEGGTEDVIYFDPFLLKFFSKNPFVLEERNYPIDFGFLRNYEYIINITIPEGYSVSQIPEKQAIALPDGKGALKFNCGLKGNTISIFFSLALKEPYYVPGYYDPLKELFNTATNIQTKSLVVLKKE